MRKIKGSRVIYRFWHNRSARGRVGYIGKDTKYPRRVNLLARRKDRGCPKLYEALNKYSVQVWRIEVLASGFKSNKSLNKAEISFIEKFDSRNKGYNITKGGDGGPGWKKGRHLSHKAKEKLSLANRGKNHPKWGKKDSMSTRIKKKKAAKGNKGNLGKRFSKEHRMGIARAQKSAWINYSEKQKKKRGIAMSRGWAHRRARLRKENGG